MWPMPTLRTLNSCGVLEDRALLRNPGSATHRAYVSRKPLIGVWFKVQPRPFRSE
jgi:hypothetical protein